MRYSIEDTTLTGIADALRRYRGDTKFEFEDLEAETKISKTQNATGFDSFEGNYPSGETYDTVTIPGAESIHVKMAYQTHSQPNAYVQVAAGKLSEVSAFVSCEKYGGQELTTVELTFEDTDTVTFRFNNIYSSGDNFLGYYAEVSGLHKIEVPNTYSSAEMKDVIDSIIPEESFVFSGIINYKFCYGAWDWFIEKYGRQITTSDIKDASYMFNNNSTITNIPFEFNFSNGASCNTMFNGCNKLENIPKLNFPANQTGYNTCSNMFKGCYMVTEIPEIENVRFAAIESMFESC